MFLPLVIRLPCHGNEYVCKRWLQINAHTMRTIPLGKVLSSAQLMYQFLSQNQHECKLAHQLDCTLESKSKKMNKKNVSYNGRNKGREVYIRKRNCSQMNSLRQLSTMYPTPGKKKKKSLLKRLNDNDTVHCYINHHCTLQEP